MNKITRKQGAAFLLLVVTGVLLVFGLVFAIDKKGIESAEAAAWVQAAASVGTIIAAVWIMHAQHNRAELAQAKQVATEKANVIAAIAFFAVEVQGLLRAANGVINDARIPRDRAQVIVSRLHSALAAVADIPIWKSPLDETAEMRIILAACRNVVAGIEAADAADQILQQSVGRLGLLPTYAAGNLPALFSESATSISDSLAFLDRRYLAIAGEPLRI